MRKWIIKTLPTIKTCETNKTILVNFALLLSDWNVEILSHPFRQSSCGCGSMKELKNSHLQTNENFLSKPSIFREMSFMIFLENSICLMLFPSLARNLSCESSSNFHRANKNSPKLFNPIISRMIYIMFRFPDHSTEKNLIKIWKWLHGTENHPPNYVNW